jgi:hypothetical protein
MMRCAVCIVCCVVWCAVCVLWDVLCVAGCAVCVAGCAVFIVLCALCGVLGGFARTSSCRHFSAADEPGTRHIRSPPFEITAAACVVLVSMPSRGSSVGVVYSYKLGDRE